MHLLINNSSFIIQSTNDGLGQRSRIDRWCQTQRTKEEILLKKLNHYRDALTEKILQIDEILKCLARNGMYFWPHCHAKTDDLSKLICLLITNYKENKKQEQILYLFKSGVVG